jgi:hypothetical protein
LTRAHTKNGAGAVQARIGAILSAVRMLAKSMARPRAADKALAHDQIDELSRALLDESSDFIGAAVTWSCRVANCPDGREVCGCPLKLVIWAGRNQSLHFEQVKMIDDNTVSTLQKMGEAGGSPSLKLPREGTNLALEVVDALNWTSFESYRDDMASLLGCPLP